jgi:BirA family transcriptional regulator, biotin operon repressor / biotin---[acetyl-CoA-carboxylase] ligase
MTALGRPRLHLRSTDSTNERAKVLARGGAPHGTLVTADSQTKGRGRQGREWKADPGTAVLMSVVLHRFDELLPLAAAVAVCEACEHAAGVECAIKWPNDVWVEGRKLAGILVEGRPQEGWAVVGVGLNVGTTEFPEDLREIATSLAIAGSGRPGTGDVLEALLLALGRWLEADSDAVRSAWRSRDALHGQTVRWEGGEGTANGIDEGGALLVETAGGVVALDAGEVHLRR